MPPAKSIGQGVPSLLALAGPLSPSGSRSPSQRWIRARRVRKGNGFAHGREG